MMPAKSAGIISHIRVAVMRRGPNPSTEPVALYLMKETQDGSRRVLWRDIMLDDRRIDDDAVLSLESGTRIYMCVGCDERKSIVRVDCTLSLIVRHAPAAKQVVA